MKEMMEVVEMSWRKRSYETVDTPGGSQGLFSSSHNRHSSWHEARLRMIKAPMKSEAFFSLRPDDATALSSIDNVEDPT